MFGIHVRSDRAGIDPYCHVWCGCREVGRSARPEVSLSGASDLSFGPNGQQKRMFMGASRIGEAESHGLPSVPSGI